MSNTIKQVTEALIRLIRAEIESDAVLTPSDTEFEVKRTPSLLLQGPRITENFQRRSMAHYFETDEAAMTFESCRAPRMYHLDFDLVVTTKTGGELLDYTHAIARFYQAHPLLSIADEGNLNLTEETPLGGSNRVNLSNLRQASGRLRIEDCPVYNGLVKTGKLVETILQEHFEPA